MRDTAELNSFLQYAKENLFKKSDLLKLFRSFGSPPSMFPKGGNLIWGDEKQGFEAPDNETVYMIQFLKNQEEIERLETGPEYDEEESYWARYAKELITKLGFLNETTPHSLKEEPISPPLDVVRDYQRASLLKNYTVEDIYLYLRKIAPNYMELVDRFYSFGAAADPSDPLYTHQKYWTNPLETVLPTAPDVKIWCLYGIGKDTERAYFYQEYQEETNTVPIAINHQLRQPETKLSNGVQLSDGDGTVPLISLGYVCEGLWKQEKFNPSHIPVTTIEYLHRPQRIKLQGGPFTADHVDIMGNHELIEHVIKIISGHEEEVEKRILSNLPDMVKKVKLPSKEKILV